MYVKKTTGYVVDVQNDYVHPYEKESPNSLCRVYKTGRVLTLKEEPEMWDRESYAYVLPAKKSVSKKNSVENNQYSDDCTLMQQLSNYCDTYFKKCGECGNQCSHPSGKCSGSCADCLKEIQYHRSDGRAEYDCKNMLRYYTCHTIWKRCSEMMYALETIDLDKYPRFNILSIGCGAAPDFMAFHQITGKKGISYQGVDIENKWKDIHDFIKRKADYASVNFERRDIYEMLAEPSSVTNPQNSYNVVVLQYMIAGHIYSDRAEKISFLFDEIIDKLITPKSKSSPLLLIINDIDHKAWICDYFNLFTNKLREHGLTFQSNKRHFDPREDGNNAGSKIYTSRANKFTSMIPEEHREKYNAHASCSAAQLIIEVT